MGNDLLQRPYAEFLEKMMKIIADEDPPEIAICLRRCDGKNITGYYGCSPEAKATMGYHIQTDAVMDVIMANADRIVRRAEEMEQDGED